MKLSESNMMGKLAFLCLLLGCQGLELSLLRDGIDPGLCGVLLCEEHTSSGNFDQDLPLNTDVNISSLTIFRVKEARSWGRTNKYNTNNNDSNDGSSSSNNSDSYNRAGGNQNWRRTLLATITTTNPSVSDITVDGVKILGQLSTRRATLRLDLTQEDACRADYVCQVRVSDALGRQSVSTSHLLQRQQQWSGNQGNRVTWEPAVAMQVISLAHKMDKSLALVAQAIDQWEEKFNRLEDAVKYLENRFEDKLAHQLKLSEVGAYAKLDRLEDSIRSAERVLARKIDDAAGKYVKLTSDRILNHLQEDVVTVLGNRITDLSKVVSVGSEIRDSNTSSISSTNQQCQNQGVGIPSNSLQPNVCNLTAVELVRCVNGSVSLIQQSLNARISSIIQSSLNESRSPAANVNCNSSTEVDDDGSRDRIKFTECKRGMSLTMSKESTRFVLTEPRLGDSSEKPYLCDAATDSGGWIIIQRRTSQNVDFYRDWEAYASGFGSVYTNFWLGNRRIHKIVSEGAYELRVDLQCKLKFAFAFYNSFYISSEEKNFTLYVGAYGGTAGDSFTQHSGAQFSTFDRDNDLVTESCATKYTGAWWYKGCHSSNLNGKWGGRSNKGPRWNSLSGADPCSFTEMKIRKVF